jgi:5'(3')-deoxyribonucleotidase
LPNPEKICLFDLDGTLVDYEGRLRDDLNKMASPGEPYDINNTNLHKLEDELPFMKARMETIKAKPGWWANLPGMMDGFEIFRVAQEIGFDIHILTQGPKRATSAWSQKFEWFQQNVQSAEPEAKITITRDKGLVYGRVLVDDWPEYVERWLKFRPRGLVIMPDRPYNATFSHPQVQKAFWRHEADNNLDQVRSMMERAFER